MTTREEAIEKVVRIDCNGGKFSKVVSKALEENNVSKITELCDGELMCLLSRF